MPDEEIDKLLRDAANQHHPPYDDTAWGKMETLLDKHLPEKKDRKRPVIFLLIFLLVGGAIFWGVESAQKNSSEKIADNATDKNAAATVATGLPSTKNNNDAVIAGTATDKNSKANGESALSPGTNTLNNVVANTSVKDDAYANGRSKNYTNRGRTAMKVKSPVATGDDDNSPSQKNTTTKTDGDNSIPSSADDKKTMVDNNNTNPVTKQQDVAVEKADNSDVAKTAKEKTPAEKNTTSSVKEKKNNKTVADKLAITVSAGADLSYVTINNAGKIKPVYGAGLKYNIGKHVSISSGLNISKKIYTALPTQYKFVGYTNPNLVKINADCNVYEIPLTVYYNFKQAKNHGWFAGVGLSSLLMKKETYDYYYQNSSGQAYSYDKTVSNENKHFLSVLSLSAGYQYQLNKRVSFMAEPYLKVPLSGIGLGKIKLNSTGVLLTAAVKPFSKKKK